MSFFAELAKFFNPQRAQAMAIAVQQVQIVANAASVAVSNTDKLAAAKVVAEMICPQSAPTIDAATMMIESTLAISKILGLPGFTKPADPATPAS